MEGGGAQGDQQVGDAVGAQQNAAKRAVKNQLALVRPISAELLHFQPPGRPAWRPSVGAARQEVGGEGRSVYARGRRHGCVWQAGPLRRGPFADIDVFLEAAPELEPYRLRAAAGQTLFFEHYLEGCGGQVLRSLRGGRAAVLDRNGMRVAGVFVPR